MARQLASPSMASSSKSAKANWSMTRPTCICIAEDFAGSCRAACWRAPSLGRSGIHLPCNGPRIVLSRSRQSRVCLQHWSAKHLAQSLIATRAPLATLLSHRPLTPKHAQSTGPSDTHCACCICCMCFTVESTTGNGGGSCCAFSTSVDQSSGIGNSWSGSGVPSLGETLTATVSSLLARPR